MARRFARTATQDGVPSPDTDATPTTAVRARRPGNGAAAEQARRRPPTVQQIAARAYELFLARGGEHGYHEVDWLQAERELANTDPQFPLPPRDVQNR